MTAPDQRELDLAIRAARAAGEELMRRWELPFSGRESKSSTTDEVSDADRAAERIVLDLIREAFPEDAVVSEEAGAAEGRSGRRWAVDPLDGTINYLYRIPQWCVSVACSDRQGPLAGVVYGAPRDELFYATRGGGAWLRAGGRDDRRLAVSEVNELGLALLADGFSYDPEERREQARRELAILPVVRDVRRLGAAALDLAFVAAGRIDAYSEANGNEWDWAAGRLLVTEAGGRVSEAPGLRPGSPTLVASGAAIHDPLMRLIADVQRRQE